MKMPQRKTPPHKASDYAVGTRKRGNDRRLYAVVTDANGKKRWKYSPPAKKFHQMTTTELPKKTLLGKSPEAYEKYSISVSQNKEKGVFNVRYHGRITGDVVIRRINEVYWSVYVQTLYEAIRISNEATKMEVTAGLPNSLVHDYTRPRRPAKKGSVFLDIDHVRKFERFQTAILDMFFNKKQTELKPASKMPKIDDIWSWQDNVKKLASSIYNVESSGMRSHFTAIETVKRSR